MGEQVDADVVVTGIGVRPAVDWLSGSGIALDTGVVVDERKRQKKGRNSGYITYWHPVIHYTAEGREYESEYPVGQRLGTRLEVGSSVDVFYDPSDPEKYHLAGDMADYSAGKHCIAGGLLGLVGAAAFAFYAYFS